MVPKCFPHLSMRIQPRNVEGSKRMTVSLQLCPMQERPPERGSRQPGKKLHQSAECRAQARDARRRQASGLCCSFPFRVQELMHP